MGGRFGPDYPAGLKRNLHGESGWVSGGFFVLNSNVFNYIKDNDTIWEKESMENLAKDGELVAYKYTGFWKSMDSLRDKRELENIWDSGKVPWKVW